jgi:alkaline phosphatase D
MLRTLLRGKDPERDIFRLGRRAFLRQTVLGPAATLVGCATGGFGLGSEPFSFGPVSAEVTSSSALVWLRARARSRVQVEYGLDRELSNALSTSFSEATTESDYTVTIEATGLDPGRQYFYRGIAIGSGASGEATRGPIGRFRTAPDSPQEFRFAWSGDMEAGHQPFTLFDRIAEKEPHFFILLGDTIYADVPKGRFVPSLSGYRYKHRENRSDAHLQRFLASTPVFAMWDDHEVENDFDGSNTLIPEGRRAFREYWPIRTADPTILYRRFSWGPAADFFVLDCRQYRSAQTEAEGPAKTMLGKLQKEWFMENIRSSRAPFKFVVSSVPFLGAWGPDKWSGYPTEREELRRFFRSERITGVIILSADIHAARDQSGSDGLREFVVGPIAAWPLCQLVRNLTLQWWEASGPFFICDAFNYGLVTVQPGADPPEAEIQILDGANTLRHRATVHA